MSIFRSYYSKNNTLINSNTTNNGQNPVTEIAYGSPEAIISRFIFDVDLSNLLNKIDNGFIIPNNLTHILHMTNTIAYAPQYVGKKSYSTSIDRANSFELELFNINEDWDEGSGYDFFLGNYVPLNLTEQASNWKYRKTDILWSTEGIYESGVTQIFGSQTFDKGSEMLSIDVTDYINQRLFNSGTTYSGDSYGLGLKFIDNLEEINTLNTQAVAFHAKNTNTWYEPYIETIIDDSIIDDRNYFYQNKDNYLYLYVNIGGANQNIIVNNVIIYDNDDNVVTTISGDSVINVKKGVYKILLNIDSEIYPDSVLFKDEWNMNINGRNTQHIGEFYLISDVNYYSFNQSNNINFDNYYFYFWGISEKEKISAGNVRKVNLTIKELYPNQNNFIPLDIEYRIFTTIADKYEIDVVPFTSVDRTCYGYEFNIDTSWLIPQDYKLQIRMKNGNYFENKQTLSFTIISNKISGIF
jgi:hypothetical protein